MSCPLRSSPATPASSRRSPPAAPVPSAPGWPPAFPSPHPRRFHAATTAARTLPAAPCTASPDDFAPPALIAQPSPCLLPPVANRGQKELEPLVGFFVNSLALRANCEAGRTFREYLSGIREMNVEAQSHQDVPLEMVVERVKPRRSASHEALFQILFSMNTAVMGAESLKESK